MKGGKIKWGEEKRKVQKKEKEKKKQKVRFRTWKKKRKLIEAGVKENENEATMAALLMSNGNAI